MDRTRTKIAISLASALLVLGSVHAGPLRELLMQRRSGGMPQRYSREVTLPPNVRVQRDVAYGSDPQQRFDVYLPPRAHDAPVILLVHGGGWQRGDKAMNNVVQNKLTRWVPRGLVLISVDYPMLPQADPLQQARSVAQALAWAQRHAAEWGADPRKFILMGHSAGSHLISLISAEPSIAISAGAQPWLGTVALDSAAFDVAQIMRGHHLPLYDQAFGSDPSSWNAASPLAQLHSRMAPFLAVCSSRRDESCPQAQAFVDKARSFGTQARVLPENLSHEEINEQLGLPSGYTTQVEAFMAGLDPAVASALR
ncbi:MAG TPA: alpha/beta hydrolase [Rhodanobacteraceae bacterium]|nr:alpha/beta hydrolase [Rhodanobacteraceae bacterium]